MTIIQVLIAFFASSDCVSFAHRHAEYTRLLEQMKQERVHCVPVPERTFDVTPDRQTRIYTATKPMYVCGKTFSSAPMTSEEVSLISRRGEIEYWMKKEKCLALPTDAPPPIPEGETHR